MYTSPRVVISFPVDARRASRFEVLVSNLASLGLLAALSAYLLVCLTASFARLARSAVTGWFRGLLREERRARRILITAGGFGVAITLGISAGGSTLALWNASTPIGAARLSTGATSLTVNSVTNYTVPGLTTTQLLPGLSAVSPQVLTITNTSTTPLSVVPGAPVFADPTSLLAQNSNLSAVLFQSSTCAQSVDGSSVAAWTVPVVLAVGASVTACLQMTLSATAPSTVQGLGATFTIPIVGTQVRNNS